MDWASKNAIRCFVNRGWFMANQLESWSLSKRGGRRRGAGRKSRSGRPNVPHRARPAHCSRHPVLVTLRATLGCLRTQSVYPTIRRAVARANRRAKAAFRVVHYSVQANHLHLLVEAGSRDVLSRGLKSLAITLALRLNRLVRRRGQVFGDRWHGRALTTPRAVRHAIVYVLANFRKHERQATALVDYYSSAPFFIGFRELEGVAPVAHRRAGVLRELGPPSASPVATPKTWLLAAGWQKGGTIGLREAPRSARCRA